MRSTHALAGWLFAAPALTVIVVFFGLPVLAAFALSLTDFDIYALGRLDRLRWVGLDRWPPGLHFDEAVYGLMAEEILAGDLHGPRGASR